MDVDDDAFALPSGFDAELAAGYRQHDRHLRAGALRMLWAPAVKSRPRDSRKGWTVYDGHVRARGEEWTAWRGIVATIAILLNRRHGQRQVDAHRARTGSLYEPSFDLGHWDARSDGYGYDFSYLRLYSGCRVEIGTDGECTM